MFEKFNFILEIGSEEIPAGYIPPAIENYKNIFSKKLTDNNLSFNDIAVYATPRRFVIAVSGMPDKQNCSEIELKGPALDRAYEDGKQSKALQGFLSGNNLTEADLEKRETPKGIYLFAKKTSESKPAISILPIIIEETLKEIPFPKKMHWSTKSIMYPRPIRYIFSLFNNCTLNFEIDGIISSNKTRGHFIQNNTMVEISNIADYEKTLKSNGVIISKDDRKDIIRKQLIETAKSINAAVVDDEELLNTVTFLVENPHTVICEFSEKFLSVPDIVLIAEMREHQKFFALRNDKGLLINKFLVVSNNPESSFVKDGNARVITARFSDAEFFYKEDRKHSLFSKVESLKTVLFHKDLGSIYDKVMRMSKVADIIIKELSIDESTAKKIHRSILLSKADLNTAMVMEFTSLQGKIGKIYATLDGEDSEVANAIDDHYKPRFHGDDTPSAIVSIVLSLSEKIDNILGSYSVGNIPKGSQDPYALRRQAFALIDLLIKNNLHLNVNVVVEKASSGYKLDKQLLTAIIDFINTRAKTRLQDENFKYDEIDACLSVNIYDYYELFLRARSLNTFRQDENFSKMLLSFKRMNNILNGFISKNKDYILTFNPSLLSIDAEKKLHAFFDDKKSEISALIDSNNYIDLFKILIEAKSLIDLYFDKVMVMDKDIAVRDNRLAMLNDILNRFKELIDFSKISE